MIKSTFSILLPVKNGGDYLRYSILSILNQTLTDFELIISVNPPTDNTVKMIEEFNDSRITTFTHTHEMTMYENHQFLLNKAKGEFIKFMHHDDLLLPKTLEICKEIFTMHEKIACIMSTAIMIDSDGSILGDFPWCFGDKRIWEPGVLSLLSLRLGNIIGNPPSTIYRHDRIKGLHFNTDLTNSADWDFLIKVTQSFHTLSTGNPMIMYRVHNHSDSTYNKTHFITQSEDMSIIKKYRDLLEPLSLYKSALLRQHLQILGPYIQRQKQEDSYNLESYSKDLCFYYEDLSLLENGNYKEDLEMLHSIDACDFKDNLPKLKSISIRALFEHHIPLSYDMIDWLLKLSNDQASRTNVQVILFGYQQSSKIMWELSKEYSFSIKYIVPLNNQYLAGSFINNALVLHRIETLKDIEAVVVCGANRLDDFNLYWKIAQNTFLEKNQTPKIIRMREWIL